MAPPIKLTPELHTRIINLVRSGAYIETAAASAGISKQTLYTWLRKGRGENADPAMHAFAEEVDAALAQDELRSALQIEQLAGSQGAATRSAKCTKCNTLVTVPVPSQVQLQAVTWKLERKYPERYGHQLRLEHKMQSRVEELLDSVRPRMSESAYVELVNAIAAEMGEPDLVEAATSAALDESARH